MDELIPASFDCSYCGEENETFVDPSGGSSQLYTEDCQVCCRPNVLRISILPDGTPSVQTEFEG